MGAITPFLKDEAVFDPDDIQALSMALDDVCAALKLNGDIRSKETVATRIIELARRGERSDETAGPHPERGERRHQNLTVDSGTLPGSSSLKTASGAGGVVACSDVGLGSKPEVTALQQQRPAHLG
jgi:hypothetical protein